VTVRPTDYTSMASPAWCPGCGDFGILAALKKAMVALDIEPYKVLFVSGIGQAGKLPHYTRGNVFNTLHGRTLPAATAAKLANAELTVIAVGGDGDGYGEGGNHFIHAMHRNPDITYIVHDNQVYALTKGQASPTSDPGYVTKTTPEGAYGQLNPMALAIASDCSFVARGFAGDIDHLAHMVRLGIEHKGFSLIDVFQPCVTFNPANGYAFYRERVYKLAGDYDRSNLRLALDKSLELEDKIPIGIVYKTERPVYTDFLNQLKEKALVEEDITNRDLNKFIAEFI